MAASSVVYSGSYVEVYAWLAKDSKGYTTTSSEGGRLEQKNQAGLKKGGNERCGHASMQIFPEGKPSTYISFWPDVVHFSDPAILIPSLDEEQTRFEGAIPDVIIRLHHLSIPMSYPISIKKQILR